MQTIGLPEIDAIKVIVNLDTVVLISAVDNWIISTFPKWKVSKEGYVVCSRSFNTGFSVYNETIFLHRLVMKETRGCVVYVDHINRNKLDNRRNNLRIATPLQSAANTAARAGSSSIYKGVCKRENKKNPYSATMKSKGFSNILGDFNKEDLAAKLFDLNALLHYGEFAFLNFPDKKYSYFDFIKKNNLTNEFVLLKRKNLYFKRPFVKTIESNLIQMDLKEGFLEEL